MPTEEDNPILEYYFDFLSQPSRALHILLQASHQRFNERAVDLLQGEHLTDEYKLHVNRFQKVPAIIDGNFKLCESIAILRYLVETKRIAENFYSYDIEKRARIDEFLSWQHTGIRTSCSLFFRFQWVEAKLMGQPASPEKVAKYRAAMERDLQLMETVWLSNDIPFLVGNQLTAADVFGACEVEQIRVTGYDVSTRYPRVATWIENVRRALRPYFDNAHEIIYKYEIETKAKL